MGESGSKYTFSRAVTQVDKSASRCVESIVPAIRVFVFPGTLDPLDEFEETIEFHLTVRQSWVNYATLSSFLRAHNVSSTIIYTARNSLEKLRALVYLSHAIRPYVLCDELVSICNNIFIPLLKSLVLHVWIRWLFHLLTLPSSYFVDFPDMVHVFNFISVSDLIFIWAVINT